MVSDRSITNLAWEGATKPVGAPDYFIQWFANTYVKRDSYMEQGVTGTSNSSAFKPSDTASAYDAYNRLMSWGESSPTPGFTPRVRYFGYDMDGQILFRREGKWISGALNQGSTPAEVKSNLHHYTFASGQQIGEVNELGVMDVFSRLTAFDTGGSAGLTTVVVGDTLQSIAQRVYGNSSLWYVLAAANSIDDSGLRVGTQLKVPDVKTNKNDSATFKPYNPAEIIGDTSPSLPFIAPPPVQSCSAGMILMIVVAVVATVFTAGAALAAIAGETATFATAGLGAAMAAGAIGGAVGSLASQAVGLAIDEVDHFSLRSVVAGAISGAITAGVGSGSGFAGTTGQLIQAGKASFTQIASSAILNSAAGYVGNKIAGVQGTSFSWKSIASGAVSSVATGYIGKGLHLDAPAANGGSGDFVNDLYNGAIGSVVSTQTKRAFGIGEKTSYGALAADVFGNAIGNAIYGRIQDRAESRKSAETVEKGISAISNKLDARLEQIDAERAEALQAEFRERDLAETRGQLDATLAKTFDEIDMRSSASVGKFLEKAALEQRKLKIQSAEKAKDLALLDWHTAQQQADDAYDAELGGRDALSKMYKQKIAAAKAAAQRAEQEYGRVRVATQDYLLSGRDNTSDSALRAKTVIWDKNLVESSPKYSETIEVGDARISGTSQVVRSEANIYTVQAKEGSVGLLVETKNQANVTYYSVTQKDVNSPNKYSLSVGSHIGANATAGIESSNGVTKHKAAIDIGGAALALKGDMTLKKEFELVDINFRLRAQGELGALAIGAKTGEDKGLHTARVVGVQRQFRGDIVIKWDVVAQKLVDAWNKK